jgi:hypothetical protein
MIDRLSQLLDENPVLYGIIARDATPIDSLRTAAGP